MTFSQGNLRKAKRPCHKILDENRRLKDVILRQGKSVCVRIKAGTLNRCPERCSIIGSDDRCHGGVDPNRKDNSLHLKFRKTGEARRWLKGGNLREFEFYAEKAPKEAIYVESLDRYSSKEADTSPCNNSPCWYQAPRRPPSFLAVWSQVSAKSRPRPVAAL